MTSRLILVPSSYEHQPDVPSKQLLVERFRAPHLLQISKMFHISIPSQEFAGDKLRKVCNIYYIYIIYNIVCIYITTCTHNYLRSAHFWIFWNGTLRSSIHQINVCPSMKVWSHTRVSLVLSNICQLKLPNMASSFLPYAIRLPAFEWGSNSIPAEMKC